MGRALDDFDKAVRSARAGMQGDDTATASLAKGITCNLNACKLHVITYQANCSPSKASTFNERALHSIPYRVCVMNAFAV
jgi:hypothetical protein